MNVEPYLNSCTFEFVILWNHGYTYVIFRLLIRGSVSSRKWRLSTILQLWSQVSFNIASSIYSIHARDSRGNSFCSLDVVSVSNYHLSMFHAPCFLWDRIPHQLTLISSPSTTDSDSLLPRFDMFRADSQPEVDIQLKGPEPIATSEGNERGFTFNCSMKSKWLRQRKVTYIR